MKIGSAKLRLSPRVRRKVVFLAVALILVLFWTAAAVFSSCGITYLLTGEVRRLNLAELPSWQAPVCILFAFLVTAVLAWKMRLIPHLVLFVSATGDERH